MIRKVLGLLCLIIFLAPVIAFGQGLLYRLPLLLLQQSSPIKETPEQRSRRPDEAISDIYEILRRQEVTRNIPKDHIELKPKISNDLEKKLEIENLAKKEFSPKTNLVFTIMYRPEAEEAAQNYAKKLQDELKIKVNLEKNSYIYTTYYYLKIDNQDKRNRFNLIYDPLKFLNNNEGVPVILVKSILATYGDNRSGYFIYTDSPEEEILIKKGIEDFYKLLDNKKFLNINNIDYLRKKIENDKIVFYVVSRLENFNAMCNFTSNIDIICIDNFYFKFEPEIVQSTIVHELAHIEYKILFRKEYALLDEGLANFMQETYLRSIKSKESRFEGFFKLLSDGKLEDIKNYLSTEKENVTLVENEFDSIKDSAHYFESVAGAFINWLHDSYGGRRLFQFFLQVAQFEKKYNEASQKVFGLPYRKLIDQFISENQNKAKQTIY